MDKLNQKGSKIAELIEKGREQGYLTYSDVNDHLPDDISDPDQVDEIIGMINMDAGIDNGFLPEDGRIIAKTAMIGGGETTSVSFEAAKLESGKEYTFFCSFPGHYGIMRGKLAI